MKKTGKKKGKKGKKGKKKDAGQRKKKSGMPEMTWKEALLAYDISVKEKSKEDIMYELKQVEDQNVRLKARNKYLKQEQENAINVLLKASKEFERQLNAKDVVTKEQVVDQMKANWESKNDNKKKLAELEELLVKRDAEIEVQAGQVAYWQEYRDKGQYEHKKTIQLLQQEITDMEESFAEITTYLRSTLDRAKEEIEKTTTEILDRQKYIATEKAVAKMDKYSQREVIDNDWLTHETIIHRKETDELFKVVEKLEEENLKILSELFECQVEDLHISRNFFMTQFADNDGLSKKTVLDIDLNDFVHHPCNDALNSCVERCEQQQPPKKVKVNRPKSAIHQAVEDKMFLLEQLYASRTQERDFDNSSDDAVQNTFEDTEEDNVVDEFVAVDGDAMNDGDSFLEFHQFDDKDFDDYLKLGPLELKLLSISGQPMPIYKPPTPPDDVLTAKEARPDDWPVTHKMLRNALHRSPREGATVTDVDSKQQSQLVS